MLEKIPGYNPNLIKSPRVKASSGVDLAPVTFYPSRHLWLIECATYGAMFVFATVALFPFFLTAFYWPVIWLFFALSIVIVIHQRWRAKNSKPFRLAIKKNHWQLQRANKECSVELYGDVLLWQWVIIITVREITSGKKHYLIGLQDSMEADDWRRLRVWLRTCLHLQP